METKILSVFSEVYFIYPHWSDYLLLALSLLFLYFSSFFSSSEVAFFSLNQKDSNEIYEGKSKNLLAASKLLNSPQKLLATLIIGANVVNISFLVLSTTFIYRIFNFEYTPIWSFLAPLIFVGLFFIVFGQLMPKVYASEHSKQIIQRNARILLGLQNLFNPFVGLLANSKALVFNKLAKINVDEISVDELSYALDMNAETQEEDKEMLEGIIKFGNIQVSDIMTSRVDVVDVDTKLNYKKLLEIVIDSGYSRLPVYSGSRDNIKGILFSKDLLPFLDKPDSFRWQTLIRQAYYVPETKKIDDLLIEFQENRIHLALVVDEYGGISGLITLEDIIEEIVGDIIDEYDEEEVLYQKIDNHTYVFEAKILLNDFYKITELDEKEFDKINDDVETLAGMILELKGEIPSKNEQLQYKHFVFEVLQVDNRRIKKIKLHIKNDPDKPKDNDN